MPVVTASEARQQAAIDAIANNNSRFMPELPASIQRMSEETCVWVYNVGPWQYMQEPGCGSFFIPACKEGEEYATMRPIPGEWADMVIRDETSFELRLENGAQKHGGSGGGRYIAEQIVGVGMHLHPDQAITKWGVFIGSQVGPKAKPTKKELEEARATLAQTMRALANEADTADRVGPKELEQVLTDKHHFAAKFLELDPTQHAWVRRDVTRPAGSQKCPMCRTPADADAVMCGNEKCGFVLDVEAFNKLKSRMAANMK